MLGWELPPHNSGGLGEACYQLSKALVAEGEQIDFVVPYEADYPDINFMNIIPVTEVTPSTPYFGAYENGTPDGEQYSYGLEGMLEVQVRYGNFVEQLVKDNPPDVVHAHDWLTMDAGIRASRAAGVPLVVHVHATEFDRAGGHRGNPMIHEIEQRGLDAADLILPVGGITKNVIIDNYHIDPDKIEVVYNSIDLDQFPPCDYDRNTYRYVEDLKADGYTVFGTITRLTAQKGLEYFVQAAAKALAQHDKMAFLLFGVGESRDELISLSASLGITDRFIFGGYVRGKDKLGRDAYNLMDAFVMSSVSEPFGLTALEAAHHDTALMISNQSGVGEILEYVYRFDYWDTDRLAQGMVDISRSEELKNTLKRGVKEEYDRLTWRDIAKQCVSIYNRVQSRRSTV